MPSNNNNRGRGNNKGLSNGRGRGFSSNNNSNSLRPNIAKENDIPVNNIAPIVDNTSSLIINFPAKPQAKCTLGTPIKLRTNHYNVLIKKDIVVQHYDVTIKQEGEDVNGKEIAKEFMLKLIEEVPSLRNNIFYDFGKSLFCLQPINKVEVNFSFVHKRNTKACRAEIKHVGEIVIKKDGSFNPFQITMLQLALTFDFKMNFIGLNSQRFFNSDCEKKQLGFNVDLWNGFFVSLRPSENGLTVNLNLFNGAFTRETNLVDLACQYFNECSKNELITRFNSRNTQNCNQRQRDKKTKEGFAGLIKQFQISPTHLTYRSKKRALGLGKSAGESLIAEKNMNLIDYFEQTYNITLNFPDLPCVDFGNGNLTPLELCVTVVENKKNLDKFTQAEYIKKTAVPCKEREHFLNNLQEKFFANKDPLLNEMNITIESKMIEFEGRVLDSPELEYGSNKIVKVNQGRWDNIGKQFYSTKDIPKWIVYSFCSNLIKKDLNTFIGIIKDTAKIHGLNINEPMEVFNENEENFLLNDFEKDIQKYEPNFILAILPGKSGIYNDLKTVGDLKFGIQTQAINISTIIKLGQIKNQSDLRKLASNICLKINSKNGGINFILNQKEKIFAKYLKEFMLQDDFMIFGCDVNKPSPIDKSQNRKHDSNYTESMAAVTGSIDKNWSYYAARMIAQKKEKKDSIEYINDLKYPVKELLNEYFKANGSHPKRLVLFRDGISEGEFQKVCGHEMNEIRTACIEIDPSYKPGVTYIVVQKRHHSRFFPTDRKDEAGKCGNVNPGCLVDCRVVTPDMFDYFLSSHLGIQGTTKPCHYYILHDENEFNNEKIMLLSHYLCHIYERSTTAVSYPAPTYYADLCAERARQYVSKEIRVNLSYPKTNSTVETYPIKVHVNFTDKMFFI